MALNLLCSQGWLELWSPFASASQVLELQACAVMPGLCSAGNRTRDFTHARRGHYQLSYIPRFYINILRCWHWIWHQACSQESVCIRGLECCSVVECLWKGLGSSPSTENSVCVSVCARVCIAVASVCLSVLRFESLGFYKSRCHFHSLSVSLILSQPLHLLLMGASNGALRDHPISYFLFTLHPFASSCQGRPSGRSGQSRSQCWGQALRTGASRWRSCLVLG